MNSLSDSHILESFDYFKSEYISNDDSLETLETAMNDDLKYHSLNDRLIANELWLNMYDDRALYYNFIDISDILKGENIGNKIQNSKLQTLKKENFDSSYPDYTYRRSLFNFIYTPFSCVGPSVMDWFVIPDIMQDSFDNYISEQTSYIFILLFVCFFFDVLVEF